MQNFLDKILCKFDLIFFFEYPQLTILFAHNLPFCLSPMFKIGILKVGASKIPLDEFPIKPDEYLIREKYFFFPRDLKIKTLLCFFLYFFIIFINSLLSLSAFGNVNIL